MAGLALPRSVDLADYSQVDMLGVRYTPVNLGAEKVRVELCCNGVVGKVPPAQNLLLPMSNLQPLEE